MTLSQKKGEENIMKQKEDMLLDYEVEMAYITKRSVRSLIIVNPRKVRKEQVKSIYFGLVNGKHFESPLVINRVKGYTMQIVDGQHRKLAMDKYFEKFPDARIQVALAVYKSLKDEEVREIYRKWNISIRQNTDDFINSYKDSIPVFDRIINIFGCSVYGSSSKIKMRDLINAYIASYEKPYKGGEKKTKIDFVKYMQNMTDEDINKIIKVYNILQEIFNSNKVKDFAKLSAFKNIVFRSLYYIVANNIEPLGENYVKRRMKTVLANRTILDKYRRFYGRRAAVDAYHAFKQELNNTSSDKKFI